MKKTDKQVIDFAIRAVKRYGLDNEKLYRSFANYWSDNSLTQKQCVFLDEVKNGLSGQSVMNDLYIDRGYPKRVN